MPKALFITETQTLRKVVSNPKCRFVWTTHALAEIKKDRRTTVDVEYSLTNCQVTLVEYKKDILWRTRGRSPDGEWIEAVVAVFEDVIVVKVITAF